MIATDIVVPATPRPNACTSSGAIATIGTQRNATANGVIVRRTVDDRSNTAANVAPSSNPSTKPGTAICAVSPSAPNTMSRWAAASASVNM
jgi:hypothetical protein